MPYIAVGRENSSQIKLYYQDYGTGKPAVLIHGYPLNSAAWEKQIPVFLAAGYRVIAYDRRGFGRSSQPASGYDYDTFASDLDWLMTQLDLRGVTLVGFSMGTGEVVHYLGKYGSERVEKAILIGTLGPYLLKTDDNPQGVDGAIFDEIKRQIVKDRFAYLSRFFKDFYNLDVYGGERVSEEVVLANWNVAARASAIAMLNCVDAWLTDFRGDLPCIDVPTLLVHGDQDRILPYAATATRLDAEAKDCTLVTIAGGPHNICWTHAEEVNAAIRDFLRKGTVQRAA